jgi:hypothetical protein
VSEAESSGRRKAVRKGRGEGRNVQIDSEGGKCEYHDKEDEIITCEIREYDL